MALKSFLAGLAALAAGGVFGTEFTVGKRTATVDGVIAPGEYPAAFSLQYRTAERRAEDNFLSPLQAESSFAWDDERIYFALQSDAEVMRVKDRPRDGQIWEDDSIELYFSASAMEGDRYQFIFNSSIGLFDAKNDDPKWNAEGVVFKSTVRDGIWFFEGSVPWKSLGYEPKDGATSCVNLTRTYYGEGRNRVGLGAAKWAHMGMRFSTALTRSGNWKAKEEYPVMMLDASAPRWRAEAPVVPAGVKGKGVIPVVVEKDGRKMLVAEAHYAVPVPVKFKGVSTERASETMILTSENWLEKDGDAAIELEFRDFETESNVVWKVTVPAKGTKGLARQEVSVRGLPAGLYKVPYRLVGADGTVFAEDFFYYGKPKDGQAPWDGITAGQEDRVLAPWTAPDFDANGFSCWNRQVKFEHRAGKVGLVSSMKSAGREILSAPVMIDLDFKPVEFRCTRTEVGISFATYRFTAVDRPVVVDLRCEFDGLMWFKVRYGEKDLRVQDLKLRLPLRRDIVMAWDDCESVYDKVRIRPGQTGAWTADVLSAPFFWVGGEVGLMGGVPGLKGWHCRDKKNAERFEVTAEKAAVTLHFVDEPFVMDGARTLEFYLQPTPVRPKSDFLATHTKETYLRWTGYLSRFYEAKIPGMMWDERWQIFDRIRRGGRRTTYYYGSKGASPVFPWWGWYGSDWNISGNAGSFNRDMPSPDRMIDDRNLWAWTCCNSRSFLDFKVYSVDYFVNEPKYGVNDLFFDLGWPRTCANAEHGCAWKDDFGRTCFDNDVKGLRELQRRSMAILQRKNPCGIVCGHLTSTRTPSDVFYDVLTMGEAYERRVSEQHNYYEIFKPADMEVTYGMRTDEQPIEMMCQIYRTIQAYKPKLLKEFDPKKPSFDRAFRHFAAYRLIFGLAYAACKEHGPDIGDPQGAALEEVLLAYGPERRLEPYWKSSCPVGVDEPEERFIYGVTSGREKIMLVLLNDTDREMTKTVSLDLKPYYVKNPIGKDVFGHGEFSLEGGSFTVTLPPRESRFIAFE